MLFTSMPQLIVLAILFIGGLFFGLGLHPGGKKWRQRFEDESGNYSQFRRDADLRLRESNKRIAELETENAALVEREAAARKSLSDAEFKLAEIDHAGRTTAVPPIVAEPAPTAGIAVPIATAAAVPAFAADGGRTELRQDTSVEHPVPEQVIPAPTETALEQEADAPRKSWFSMGGTPDLGRIRGIDPATKTSLFGLGVTRYEDITELSDEDEMALEQRLSLPAGYITREQWRDQAELLRAGKDEEQAERFPAS